MKKNTIVVVGSSTPLQKFLLMLPEYDSIICAGIFANPEIDKNTFVWAQNRNIPVFDMELLRSEEGVKLFSELKADWLFNLNSMIIYTESILALPLMGALNLHCGKLPEYSGKHAHQWAIRNGEKEFSSTLHWITMKIDGGQIAFQESFPIEESDTGLTLYMKFVKHGTNIVRTALNYIQLGKEIPKQNQDLTKRKYFLDKDARSGTIDWNSTSESVFNLVRAADYAPFTSPTYQAHTFFQGRKLIILKAMKTNEPSMGAGKFIMKENEWWVGCSDCNLKITRYNWVSDEAAPKELLSEKFD